MRRNSGRERWLKCQGMKTRLGLADSERYSPFMNREVREADVTRTNKMVCKTCSFGSYCRGELLSHHEGGTLERSGVAGVNSTGCGLNKGTSQGRVWRMLVKWDQS